MSFGAVILCMIWFPAFAGFWSYSSVGSWSHDLIAVCLLCVLVQRLRYVWACLCLYRLMQNIFSYYCIWSKGGRVCLVESNKPLRYSIRKSSVLLISQHGLFIQMVPNFTVVQLKIFDFTMLRKQCALSRNVLWILIFSWASAIRYSGCWAIAPHQLLNLKGKQPILYSVFILLDDCAQL